MAVTRPHTTCAGVFESRQSADAAIDDLLGHGFQRDDIGIVTRGRDGVETFRGWDERGDYRVTDDNVSAGGGAALGGITGLLIGAGLMLVPGVGPLFAVGPLAAGLAGAVTGGITGAITGGIAGGLIDMGVPEDDARYYEGRIGDGAYLVTVQCAGPGHETAREILMRHGAESTGPGVADDVPSDGTRPTF